MKQEVLESNRISGRDMTLTWKAAGRFLTRHWLFTGLLLFAIIVSMTPGALERFFVYYPTRDVDASQSMVGLDYKDVFLVTEDRVRLHGWFVPHPKSGVPYWFFTGTQGTSATGCTGSKCSMRRPVMS